MTNYLVWPPDQFGPAIAADPLKYVVAVLDQAMWVGSREEYFIVAENNFSGNAIDTGFDLKL